LSKFLACAGFLHYKHAELRDIFIVRHRIENFIEFKFLDLVCVFNSRSSISCLWLYSDIDIHKEGRGKVVFETGNKENCVALYWYYTTRLCSLTLNKNCFDAVLVTTKKATL
jgi:hypothetical protein